MINPPCPPLSVHVSSPSKYLGTLRSCKPPAPLHYRKFPDPLLSHTALSFVMSKDKGKDRGCSASPKPPRLRPDADFKIKRQHFKTLAFHCRFFTKEHRKGSKFKKGGQRLGHTCPEQKRGWEGECKGRDRIGF